MGHSAPSWALGMERAAKPASQPRWVCPGMWGAGGIQVLWQRILTGCCALGDPDGW